MMAAMQNNVQIVLKIIQDAPEELGMKDNDGYTAVSIAIINNQVEAAALLQ